MTFPKSKLSFAVLMLVAFSIRAATLWSGMSSLQADPDSYARLAVNWAEFGIYGFEDRTAEAGPAPADANRVRATAYRPPLYPWLLSWAVVRGELRLPWVAALHCLLGLVTVALTYCVARALNVVAWIPALAVACDPILLRASQLVMTETLAALWVVAGWWFWLALMNKAPESKRRDSPARCFYAIGLGVCFGLAILTRPTAAVWACGCCIGWFLLVAARRAGLSRWEGASGRSLALAGLSIVVCIAPWTVRNYFVLNHPIWATTHGGYTLLLANNPLLYQHFRQNGPSRGWDAEPFHRAWADRARRSESPMNHDFWFDPSSSTTFQQLDELADNQLAYASAWATIKRSVWTFWLSAGYRIGWLWALWPYSQTIHITNICIGIWYFCWFLAAASAIVRGGRRFLNVSWLPGTLLVISLTAIHAVYWSNMRMRAPMMCVVYLAASVNCSRMDHRE